MRRRRNIILFFVVVILAGVFYFTFCFVRGNGVLNVKNAGILGMYAFFLIWFLLSVQQKERKKKREKQMYCEKDMDVFLKYHDGKRNNATTIEQREFETIQTAIGHAYKGELEEAQSMIENLRENGQFSSYINSNAIINLYIIYLYQGKLKEARCFYKENESVFLEAVDKKKGFTEPLWKAYESVLEGKYDTAKKKLEKLPKETAQLNDVYKMLMSEIMLKTGSKKSADLYMKACLETKMLPFMRQRVEKMFLYNRTDKII